jgi:predicted enzyme related to lactoylglutathione lyase
MPEPYLLGVRIMSRVVHFEIHAENPDRAIKFYAGLLGWEFKKWDGPVDYWLVMTGPKTEPGIDGGLLRRQGTGPVEKQGVNAYVCTASVTDLDATLTAVGKHGGTVVVPKMPIPTVGWLAYAKDTEGNIFGMMQADPNAR